jgi:release factor glutamine methyltransferase
MVTLSQALTHAQTVLNDAGLESPVVEAYLMLEHLLGASRTKLMLERHRVLTPAEEEMLKEWLKRRARREPLQHILGVVHFYGLELRVTPDVLVPRPETERLVELGLQAIRDIRNPKVLDVGTGSGAIALAIKHERPDAMVMGSDVSQAALDVARDNAQGLGLELKLEHSDLLENPLVVVFAQNVDLLISNPPYLPETDQTQVSPEVQADPATALYSGPDGLEHFRRLEHSAWALLHSGAVLLVELDPRNVQGAFDTAAKNGWGEGRTLADLVGRERFLWLRRQGPVL